MASINSITTAFTALGEQADTTDLAVQLARDATRIVQSTEDFRSTAAQLIDTLLMYLDATDDDPDAEEDDEAEEDGSTEPSLGAGESHPSSFRGSTRVGDQTDWGEGPLKGREDLEDEHDGREPADDDEPDVDDEPSLGSLDRVICQLAWVQGLDRDREEEIV